MDCLASTTKSRNPSGQTEAQKGNLIRKKIANERQKIRRRDDLVQAKRTAWIRERKMGEIHRNRVNQRMIYFPKCVTFLLFGSWVLGTRKKKREQRRGH